MNKTISFISVFTILALTLAVTYPNVKQLHLKYEATFYKKPEYREILSFYNYDPPHLTVADTTHLPPAKGVPILMYHGIVQEVDKENTTETNFIKQMEMLKQAGFKTITLKNLDDFLHGNFVLPPKPIVITFDDGRRDSYYPTDQVLKQLGFNATIFIVTGKQDQNDNFFLSWNDVKKMDASGRWDIEAHGQYSHDKFPIDQSGAFGRFLTSKKYIEGVGLESDADFRKRVDDDYRNCILDIMSYLNKKPDYFAVPLNDYGQRNPTNYTDATEYNQELIKKYFKLAFIQANDSTDVTQFHRGIYNYADSNPYLLHRIEVKNMDSKYLKKILDQEYPQNPYLTWSNTSSDELASWIMDFAGAHSFDDAGMHLITTPQNPASSVFLGDDHWKNYSVTADIQKLSGGSFSLLTYASDASNYVQTGYSGNEIYLREYKDGVGVDISEPIINKKLEDVLRFKVIMDGEYITVYLNDKLIFHNVKTHYSRGRVGFKMYDAKENSEGLVKTLSIISNNK